jgi:hypothetical protein
MRTPPVHCPYYVEGGTQAPEEELVQGGARHWCMHQIFSSNELQRCAGGCGAAKTRGACSGASVLSRESDCGRTAMRVPVRPRNSRSRYAA